MAKKRVTRKELLKGPDEFLTFSERALIYMRGHIRQIKLAGAAVGIILLAVFALQTYLHSVDRKGQTAYNEGYYLLVENLNPDADPEKWKKAGESFQQVIREHGRSKVAPLSFPQMGLVDFLTGDYDQAIASYQAYIQKAPNNSFYRPLASLALASCYEAKGELKSAIEVLSPMEKGNIPFKEPVLLSLARVYRLDDQHEKAKGVLRSFIETHADSPYISLAKAQLGE
jgi:tetratricopeptide (TPR) repeat protein